MNKNRREIEGILCKLRINPTYHIKPNPPEEKKETLSHSHCSQIEEEEEEDQTVSSFLTLFSLQFSKISYCKNKYFSASACSNSISSLTIFCFLYALICVLSSFHRFGNEIKLLNTNS